MYEMRASIRDNQSVKAGHDRVERNAGKISESMLYEALLARDPDDGQNLLMYAVRWGRESWFLHLVQHILEKVNLAFQQQASSHACAFPEQIARSLDLEAFFRFQPNSSSRLCTVVPSNPLGSPRRNEFPPHNLFGLEA